MTTKSGGLFVAAPAPPPPEPDGFFLDSPSFFDAPSPVALGLGSFFARARFAGFFFSPSLALPSGPPSPSALGALSPAGGFGARAFFGLGAPFSFFAAGFFALSSALAAPASAAGAGASATTGASTVTQPRWMSYLRSAFVPPSATYSRAVVALL